MDAGRPDFAENPTVLALKRFQLEMGFSFQRDGRSKRLSGPEGTLRYGIARKWELQLNPPNYNWLFGDDHGRGFGDASGGLKWQAGPIHGWDLAIEASLSVDSGIPDFTSNSIDPGLLVAWGRDLDKSTNLSGSVAALWTTSDGIRVALWSNAVSLTKALGGQWAGFLEHFATFAKDTPTTHLLHAGIKYKLDQNRQLDCHAIRGLNGNSPDWLIGAGYSQRF